MESSIVEWLNSAGRTAFAWSLGMLLVVNAAAALVFLVRRDRALVNRWTGRVLAFDLLLLGTGVGVPVMTTMARMTVTLVSSPFISSGVTTAVAEAVPANASQYELGRR